MWGQGEETDWDQNQGSVCIQDLTTTPPNPATSGYFTPFIWLHHASCRTLAAQLGIKPTASSLEVCSLHHWTAREAPRRPGIQNSTLS